MNIKEIKKKNGTKVYRTSIYLGVDSITGKKVKTSITGRTKKEVKAKAQHAQASFKANGSTVFKQANIRTYKELTDLWLENYQLTVKPQTYLTTSNTIKNHILPTFGRMQLDKINITIIQSWLNKLAKHYVNFHTVHSINQRILQYAVTLQLIPFNPAREVIKPKRITRQKGAVKYIPADELKILLDHMDELANQSYNYYYDSVLYKLLLATGCRIGEVSALEWSDIDFDNATVDINKTYNAAVKLVGTPKSEAGNRVISIDNKTVLMLKQYRNRQRQIFIEAGARVPKVVFATPTATYLERTARQASLDTRCKECHITRFTFHAFRHTHASLLLNAGIGYKELQHRLGHTALAMTMDVYSHLSKDKEKEAVSYYEKALKNL